MHSCAALPACTLHVTAVLPVLLRAARAHMLQAHPGRPEMTGHGDPRLLWWDLVS